MSIVTSQQLGQQIVEALGLPDNITSITINMAVNGLATITIERFLTQGEGEALVKVLKQCELVPLDAKQAP